MLPCRGAQVRQRGVHDVVEAHDLLLEVLAERGRLHPTDVDLAHERARRVHERVHAPELRRHPVDRGGGGHRVEQVDAPGRGAPAEGLHVGRDGAGGVLVAAVEHGYVASPLAEQTAHGRAEAATSPGDDGDARASLEVARQLVFVTLVFTRTPRRRGRDGRGGRHVRVGPSAAARR